MRWNSKQVERPEIRWAVGPLVIALASSVGVAHKAEAQPPSTPNYLNMAPGEVRYFVGGTGTSSGRETTSNGSGDGSWSWEGASWLGPPLNIIPYIVSSPLHERVMRLTRFGPGGAYPDGLAENPMTRTASTSGQFKILALKRKAADQTRAIGQSGMLVTLWAQASSRAYPGGANMNTYTVLPAGTSHEVTLQAQAGDSSATGANAGGSTTVDSAQAESKKLITLNWDEASLCQGESDIYFLEVDTESVQASANATFEGVCASPHVGASAQAQSDNRSVTLSRANAHNEWWEGDVRHGDTTYSYSLKAINGSYQQKNTQHFTANFSEGWTTRTFYSLNTDVPEPYEVKGNGHEWSPSSEAPYIWNQASFGIPFGKMNVWSSGWEGSPTGEDEMEITYIVKDNRNNEGEVTAEQKYVLHFHDPVELDRETRSRVTVNAVLRRGNGTTIDTPNEPGGVKTGSKTIEIGVASSEGVSVGASFDVTQFIAFLGLDFQYSVQDETSLSTSATLDEDIPAGRYSYAMVTHVYERVHQYLFKYDAGGRNVRMGRAAEGDDGRNLTREVPHEAFADKYLHATTPFWSDPILVTDFPPIPDPIPPFKSTYTS